MQKHVQQSHLFRNTHKPAGQSKLPQDTAEANFSPCPAEF